MARHNKISLRHMMYSILWLGFLWLQLILFSPMDPPPSSMGLDVVGGASSSSLGAPRVLYTNAESSPKAKRKPGDALFNNIDVYYNNKGTSNDPATTSNVHCIGRDLMDPVLNANYSWMFRSCHFQRLCLNTESKEFVLIDGSASSAAKDDQELAIGAINPRWSGRGFNKGFHKVKWFPKWVKAAPAEGFYELPQDVVMVPFHSMAAHNVGHLLWDDFYPIFTLLSVFDYVRASKQHQYLLLRWTPEQKLYATCDIRPNKKKLCNENFQRFLRLLGVDRETFSSVKMAELKTTSQQPLKSSLVCSKQAVAGIGMLMDHGMIDHGWTLRDPKSGLGLVPHNIGRGSIFREFRDFMVQNMGFPLELPAASVNKITFSTHSSRGFERSLSFENQTAAVRRALQDHSEITVRSITMRDLSLEDQIQVALESAVFVTVCGGGAITATFLPPGSTLIVYYVEDGGFDFWGYNYTYNLPKYNYQTQPARLDWDLLNNAAHLKVHWLPMKTMESRGDIKVLEKLILHDLDRMGLLV